MIMIFKYLNFMLSFLLFVIFILQLIVFDIFTLVISILTPFKIKILWIFHCVSSIKIWNHPICTIRANDTKLFELLLCCYAGHAPITERTKSLLFKKILPLCINWQKNQIEIIISFGNFHISWNIKYNKYYFDKCLCYPKAITFDYNKLLWRIIITITRHTVSTNEFIFPISKRACCIVPA